MSLLEFTPPVQGRKLDVLFLHNDEPFSLTRAKQILFEGNGGKACYGLQKLAQQAMLRLYSRIGGRPYASGSGTQFVNEILQGRIKTTSDIARVFAFASETLTEQFAEDVIADSSIPLDEQLADIELVSASIRNGDELHLTIRISSRAGRSGKFQFPITVDA